MRSVTLTLRCDRRRAIAGFLVSLLAAAIVADLQLAVLFSPLLILASLITSDRRVEATIIEFVYGLAPPRRRPISAPSLPGMLRLAPGRSTNCLSPLGSRPPPLPTT